MILPVFELHIHGVIHHISSFSSMFQIVPSGSSFILTTVGLHCVNILSTGDGHLGKFQVLTILKSATMTIHMHVSQNKWCISLGMLLEETLGHRVARVQLQ